MRDLLVNAWNAGRLVRPDAGVANTIDLIHAIARINGEGNHAISRAAEAIAARIGTCEHLVFVLIDGMGINLLEILPCDAFLRGNLAMELQAVFPSTTAAAITTIATGLWPGEHGMMGWWLYLASRRISITALPFTERFSGEPLEKRGLAAGDLWPFTPLLDGIQRDARSIHPALFWDSAFNRFARGRSEGAGYTSIESAVDQVIGRIVTAQAPTFTYIYLPELDTICHHTGTDSAATLAILLQLDAQMRRLAAAMTGRARLVITADHGHQNVSAADHLALRDGDPLLETLLAPPSGEPRMPLFHIRPGRDNDFRSIFERGFGNRIALLSTAAADELRLFGPAPLSALAHERLGNYVGVPIDPVTLSYYPSNRSPSDDHASHHAGLSPAEMRIPLILA